MRQFVIFIISFIVIFIVVSKGGAVDIGTVGFVIVLVVSFLISKFAPKLFLQGGNSD